LSGDFYFFCRRFEKFGKRSSWQLQALNINTKIIESSSLFAYFQVCIMGVYFIFIGKREQMDVLRKKEMDYNGWLK
jgi:hypothetical protein